MESGVQVPAPPNKEITMERSSKPPLLDRRSSIYRRILNTVRVHDMLHPHDHVIVAVSGGGDSVFLLMALEALAKKYCLTLTVAHMNHGFRGGKGDSDARFVGELCRKKKHSFEIETLDPASMVSGISRELYFRNKRYAFLQRIREEKSAHCIATGHTADDQAETVLMRLMAGSGIRGIAGIHPRRRDGVIRPLIDLRREEIRQNLFKSGLRFMEDETNRDISHPRNHIREILIPVVEEVEKAAIAGICRTAQLALGDEHFLDQLVKKRIGKYLSHGLNMKAVHLEDISMQRRIVNKYLIREMGSPASFELTKLILRLPIKGIKRVYLRKGHQGVIVDGMLTIRRSYS